MHRDDRYNGTRRSRGDQRDNRSHRNHPEMRQRNIQTQSHNHIPQHSVPISTQYPVDHRHFHNIYPSSAYSFMLPNMSIPPPLHPPSSNMWCPQWSQTESRDYRSFSVYSGQQQVHTTEHAPGMREPISRRRESRQESIHGNIFNMPPPPVSSRVPMPMSELYPPSPEMQTFTLGTQAPSQTQVSSSRTQTFSGLQSSSSTSDLHTSTSELHPSTPEMHTSTSSTHAPFSGLQPSTSGTQSSHSRRGLVRVPESHRTTSEYVSHTLIHRVTSDVQPSASGLQTHAYPIVSESQQISSHSPSSGAETLPTRRNSVSPEKKSFDSQSTTSRPDVTIYTPRQSISAMQSNSFYPENIFEPQSGYISNRRSAVSKAHTLLFGRCQESSSGTQSNSENIYELQPSTSGYMSDRRSSTSETQSQTETDRSAGFSWLHSSLYVRPPRVIRIDMNEPEEVPVSKFFEFVSCVKRTVFPHLFFDNSDEGRFVGALNMFLKLLSDVRTSIRVPGYLLNFLMRIVHVTSSYYRRISYSREDEYLEIMEDVFVHYSEVVLALFEIWDLTEETEKPGGFIGKITRMLLTRGMLRRIDNILNCLIKIETHPSLHFHCRFLINLYWVFLRYLNFKYTDENLIRMFVIWRKFELLWPDDLAKLRECRENQLRHGKRHVVLESIPVLNEMIEVSKRDPRYSVRDVIAIYWWWWEITKDELRSKSEKERVNIIHFPKMCNSLYLAHKTPAKTPQFASNLIAVKKERSELLLTNMAKHIKRPTRIDSTLLWDFRTPMIPIIQEIQENNANITDCQWIFKPPVLDTIEIHDSYSDVNELAIGVPSETHLAIASSRNKAAKSVKLQKPLKSINTSHIEDFEILSTIENSQTGVETTLIQRQKLVEVSADLSNVRRANKHVSEYSCYNTPLYIVNPADDSYKSLTGFQDPIKMQCHSEGAQNSTSAFGKASRSIGIQSDQDVIKLDHYTDFRSDVVKASAKEREITEECIKLSNDSVQLQIDKSNSIRRSSSSQPDNQKKMDTFQDNQNDTVSNIICNDPMQISEDVGDRHFSDCLLESTQRSMGSPSKKNLEVFLHNRSSCEGDSQNVPVQATSVVRLEPEQASISKEVEVFTLADILEEDEHRIITDKPEERNSPKINDIREYRLLENREVTHSDTCKERIFSILSENQEERRNSDLHDMSETFEVVHFGKKLEIQSLENMLEGKEHHATKQKQTQLCDKQSGESVVAPGTSKNNRGEKLTLEECESRHREQSISGVGLYDVTMEVAKGGSEEVCRKTNSADVLEGTEQDHAFQETILPKYEKSKKHGNKAERDKYRVSVETQKKWSPELYKLSQNSHRITSEQMFEELDSMDVLMKEEHRHSRKNSKPALEKTENIHVLKTKEVTGTESEEKVENHSRSKLYDFPKDLTILEKSEPRYDDNSEEDDYIKIREIKTGKLCNVFEELGEGNSKNTVAVSGKLISKDMPEEWNRTKEKILDTSEKRYDDELNEKEVHRVPEKIELRYSKQSERNSENRFSNVKEQQTDNRLRMDTFPANIPVCESIEKNCEEKLCFRAKLYDVEKEGQEDKNDKSSLSKSEKRDIISSVQKSIETDVAKLPVTTKKLVVTQYDNFSGNILVVPDTSNRGQFDDSKLVEAILGPIRTKKRSQLQLEYGKEETVFEKRRPEGKDYHISGKSIVQNKKSEYPLEIGASSTQHMSDEDVFENYSSGESILITEEGLDVSQESTQEGHGSKAGTSVLVTTKKSKDIGLEGTDKCIAINRNIEKSLNMGETNRLEEEKVFFKVMKMYNETGRIESVEEEGRSEAEQNRHSKIHDLGQLGEVILNTAQAECKNILGTKMLISLKVHPNPKKILHRDIGENISSESVDLYLKNLSSGEHEYLRQEGRQTLHNAPRADVLDKNDGASDFDREFFSLNHGTSETTQEEFRDDLEFCMNNTLQFPEKCSSSMKTSSLNNRLRFTKQQLCQQVDDKCDLRTENKSLIVVKQKDATNTQREGLLPNENLNQETAILSHSRNHLDSDNDNITFGSVDGTVVSLTGDRFVSDTTSKEFDTLEKNQHSVLELDEIRLGKLKQNMHENSDEQPTVKSIEKSTFVKSIGLEQVQLSLVPGESAVNFVGKRADKYDGVVRIGGGESERSESTAKIIVLERSTQDNTKAEKIEKKPEQLNKSHKIQTKNSAMLFDETEKNADDTHSIKVFKMTANQPNEKKDIEFATGEPETVQNSDSAVGKLGIQGSKEDVKDLLKIDKPAEPDREFFSLNHGTSETTQEEFRDDLEFCMNNTLQFPEKCSSSMKTSSLNNRLGFTKQQLCQQVDDKCDLRTENKSLIVVKQKDATNTQREGLLPNENLNQETAILSHSRNHLDSDNDNITFGSVDGTVVSLTGDRFVSDTTSKEFDTLEKNQHSVLELDEIRLGKLKQNMHENSDEQPTVESIEKSTFVKSIGLEQVQLSLVPGESAVNFVGKRADKYDGVVRIGGGESERSESTAKIIVLERSTQDNTKAEKIEKKSEQLNKSYKIQTKNSAMLSDETEKNADDTHSIKVFKMTANQPNEKKDIEFATGRSSVVFMKYIKLMPKLSSEAGDEKKKDDSKTAASKSSAVYNKPETVQNSDSAVGKLGILGSKEDVKDLLKIDKPAGIAEKPPVIPDVSVKIPSQTGRTICKGDVTISKADQASGIEETKCHVDSDVASEGSRTSKQGLADMPKEKQHEPNLIIVPEMLHPVEENILVMSEGTQGHKTEKKYGRRKRRKSGYFEELKGPVSPVQYQEHVKNIKENKIHIGETSVASNTLFKMPGSTLKGSTSSSELESGMNINEIVDTPNPTRKSVYRDNILQNPQETFPSSKTLLCEESHMDTMRYRQTVRNGDQQVKDSLNVRMDITLQQISSVHPADVASKNKQVSSGQEPKPLLNDNNISLVSIDELDKRVEKRGSHPENLETTITRIPPSVFSHNDDSHLDKVLIKNTVHGFDSEMESWWPKTSGEGTLPSEVLPDLFEEAQACLEDRYTTKPENFYRSDMNTALSYEPLVRNEVQQYIQETQTQPSMSSSMSSETVPDCDTSISYGETTSASTPSRIAFANPEKRLNVRDPRLAGNSEVARLYKCSHEVISDDGQKYDESADSNVTCGSKLTDRELKVLLPIMDMDPSALNPISQSNTLASFYSTFVKEVSETDVLSPPVPDDAPLEANEVVQISESQSGTLMSFNSQHANVATPLDKIMIEEKEARTERQPLSDSQSYSLQSTPPKRRLDDILTDQDLGSDCIPLTFTQDKNSHNVKPVMKSDVQMQSVAKQTSSMLKKHVDKGAKADNDLHARLESTVIGTKKHSVTFFEEKAKEIYTREYGNQIEKKNNQHTQIRTSKRTSKVQYTKGDSEGLKPKRKKRQVEIFKKPEITYKPSRPHITAEDNDLFQNAIEGPVGKPMPSTGGTAPMMLWDDKDELCQAGTISVKSDSQLRKVKNENLVSIFKKPKSKDEQAERREYKGYKLSPSVDPKVLKEIVIRLTDDIISNSLIRRYSNERLRQDEVGEEGAKRRLEVQAEHNKVLERARMMELKEQQLRQETGILYCIFSDKWSWTEKNNSPKNNSSKSATRKVRFKGESDDSHNHRKGQQLPEKRKRHDHPEDVGRKKIKISVRTDLIAKTSKNPTSEEKEISKNGLTELQCRSRRSEEKLGGKQINDVKNDPSNLQTRSGRLRKKPSGRDYYDLTETTSHRGKSST